MQESVHVNDEEHLVAAPIAPFVSSSAVGSIDGAGSALMTNEILDHDSTLVTMLQTEAHSRNRQTVGVLTASTALLLGIVLMVPRLAVSNPETFGFRLAICFAMLFGIGGVMTASLTRRSYRSKKSLTDHIARTSAKTQVGALVRALKVDGKAVKNIAKICLTDLLPTLNATDTDLLGERERDILIKTLAISPDDKGYRDLTELWSAAAKRREIEFRVAILKAYEQVGGAKELLLVSRLAEEIPVVPRFARNLRAKRSINKMGPEIARAAAECLPYLQIRANEELASRQLLRASSADSGTERTLLRPSGAESDIPAEQLLRAVESQ